MKIFLATASALAICAGGAARAQEVYDLGEITLSSTKAGGATPLDRTGASVQVITQEDLEKADETTLAEYLARQPGLSVSANGGVGANTTLRIRGLDGKYIKVLVNGIDVTDPSSTQAQFNWGGLTTANLGRVEILKGSSSSLYGSRAVGGVVNISTIKRPDEPGSKVTLSLEGGSYETYRAAAGITYTGARGGVTFGIDRITTDGFSSKSGAGSTEPDGYRGTQITFSADTMATETLKLGLSGYALDSEGEFDEFLGDGAPPYDEKNSTKTRAIRTFAELSAGAVDHTLSFTYLTTDRVSSSNGVDTFFDGERKRLDYTGRYIASDLLTLTFGTDWEEESFTSGTDSGSVETTGLFGEVLYAPTADLDLSASARLDDHSTFGSHVTGRLAAAYRLTGATTLRAVAATGFRAPSLYELYSTLYGNPALQPEESTSFELGLEHEFSAGRSLRATAFHTRIDNLIQFVTLTSWPLPFTGQYQQVPGESRTQGVELAAEWAMNDWLGLFGNYTYTDAEDATGARLLRVPGHDMTVGLTGDFSGGWSGNVNLRHVADRPAEFGTVMGDYTVVNAGVSYAFTDNAEGYLRIENLLDETYETAAGYQASGRALYAGLRASF
ncbi:TonB-dependent receptor plug domain-containing protein [Antarcticimicrobium luteum]|nr:TonB-dependent receptor [Antarcticimicrobium luteum]